MTAEGRRALPQPAGRGSRVGRSPPAIARRPREARMAQAVEAFGAGAPGALRPSAAFLRRRRLFDRLVRLILFVAASLSVFVTAAIVYILISESLVFFA